MKNKKAFFLIILAGVLWGTSGIFVNLLSPYGFTPIQLVATRATVSLVLIGGFMLVNDRKSFCTEPKRIPLLLVSVYRFFFLCSSITVLWSERPYALLSFCLIFTLFTLRLFPLSFIKKECPLSSFFPLLLCLWDVPSYRAYSAV